jgi:sulfur carrier protein ThiS
MRVALKLYASLADHLPLDARRDNRLELEVEPGVTVLDLIERERLPQRSCHLVLVNGVYVPPDARAARVLAPGDELAIWPPIAGG